MNPTHYQSKENGPWYPWTKGYVDLTDMLRPRKEFLGSGTYVNGCLVVALKDEVTGRIWYPRNENSR